MNTNWKTQARQKLAASVSQDDKAITEAFAQQAYTAIGNRDREIMKDPYMLGFEIVSKNEENTRLVGVFAFRLGGEILLAPVFYQNGQIKGQDLLYRKGVNRFVPNTDKWVSYLKSQSEVDEGKPVDRQRSNARIHLDLAQIGGSRLKAASEGEEGEEGEREEGEESETEELVEELAEKIKEACSKPQNIADIGQGPIAGLWKKALADWKAEQPEPIMARVMFEVDFEKQACELAKRLPEWAEMVELSGALEKEAWGEADPLSSAFADRQQLAGGEAAASNYALVAGKPFAEMPQLNLPPMGGANPFEEDLSKGASAATPLVKLVPTPPAEREAYKKELDDSVASVMKDMGMQRAGDKNPAMNNSGGSEAPAKDVAPPPNPAANLPKEKQSTVTLYLEPQPGWTEPQLEAFYKQGFALMDSRDMKGLSEAYEESDFSQAWSSLDTPGVHEVKDAAGNTAKVLWAPVSDTYNDCPQPDVVGGRRPQLGSDYGLLFLDGPAKGAFRHYYSSTPETELPAFVVDSTVEKPAEVAGESLSGKKPVAGKAYAIWIPSCGRMIRPFAVGSIKTSDNVTKINFEAASYSGPRIVINDELETTDLSDERLDGAATILGKDAVFIEVQASFEYRDGAKTPANISWMRTTPPTEFLPITVGRLGDALLKTKTASVQLIPVGHGRTDIVLNGRRRAEDLSRPLLAFKLAGALGLSIEEAMELSERGSREPVKFSLVSPRQKIKLAAAYYERDIDPEAEFPDNNYDQDMDAPIYYPEDNQAIVQFRRHQQVSDQPRYLDAMGYGGPRNKQHGGGPITHIEDEDILSMADPIREMTEIGQQLGLKSLLDHGAIGSMTKIFDAAPFIRQYVDKLEGSLDYLARLLFMLYWRPKDFADVFGSDDLPNLENKLTGVFLAYGDLVLELRQSAGSDDS